MRDLILRALDFDIGKPRTTASGHGMEWWPDAFDVGEPCDCAHCELRAAYPRDAYDPKAPYTLHPYLHTAF